MTVRFRSITLADHFNGYLDREGQQHQALEPISKINIFVGANNSGKSRFMRMLAGQAKFHVTPEIPNLRDINAQLSAGIETIRRHMQKAGLRIVNQVDELMMEELMKGLPTSMNMASDVYAQYRHTFGDWSMLGEITTTSTHNSMGIGHVSGPTKESLRNKIRSESARLLELLEQVPIQTDSSKLGRVYIPTLRGLRHLNELHTDVYGERTRSDYFEGEDETSPPEIFTGMLLYQQITSWLLGQKKQRELIAAYQEFISNSLFEGHPVALIPNQAQKVLVVKIGNEKEEPIHHLGDGIQAAIILTFLPFVTQRPTMFFIEEPEMYMHPGLQRKVLSFYDSRPDHTFFLTTHSNHFLDITIDIKSVSIFTFDKLLEASGDDEIVPKFVVESVDTGDQSSLELLGVRNSSVFLVNATIWVEGITDRWYFRSMLSSYMQYLKQQDENYLQLEEDVHYSFVEYGGSNITHWSFLDYEEHPIQIKRLCSRAILIVDCDGQRKMQRKQDLEATLGTRLLLLPCREVENLLPYDLLKQVVRKYETNGNFQFPDYQYDDYRDEYLGEFIERYMLLNNFSRKGGYKSESGTLKNKVDFCKKALEHIWYEHLPQPTQEVVQQVYDFIRGQNLAGCATPISNNGRKIL